MDTKIKNLETKCKYQKFLKSLNFSIIRNCVQRSFNLLKHNEKSSMLAVKSQSDNNNFLRSNG